MPTRLLLFTMSAKNIVAETVVAPLPPVATWKNLLIIRSTVLAYAWKRIFNTKYKNNYKIQCNQTP